MANRVVIDPDLGLVISKAGFNAANASLNDDNKIFDSKWLFGGQLVMCRHVVLSYPANGPAGEHSVMYPKDLGYMPYGYVYNTRLVSGTYTVRGPVGSVGAGTIPIAQEGWGTWDFLSDRALNQYPAVGSTARTIHYLLVVMAGGG